MFEETTLHLYNATTAYFEAFSNKDLDKLSELYSEDVTLCEWFENIVQGKKEVLEANAALFNGCSSLSIEVVSQAMDLEDEVTLNEIIVHIDDKQVRVVDVISFDSEGKIEGVTAYRGF